MSTSCCPKTLSSFIAKKACAMGSSSTEGVTLISQGTGYGLLIGLAVAFCGIILIAVKIQKSYLLEDSGKSEMFMVANRSVGAGLTASAVFSSWMWINETAFSAVNCYRFGVSAPMVYLGHILRLLYASTNDWK